MHLGFDESTNNVHPIDWAQAVADLLARGGEQPFVVVKVEQGTGYTNPELQGDLAAARAAGFALAGYLMDQGNADPAAEEALYRRLVGALPQTDDIELPEGLSTEAYIAHVAELVAQNPTALDYLNQSEVEEGFPTGGGLWLAEYNGLPSTVSHLCLIHQYNDAGTVAGIGGLVDLNAWLGTEAQFASFFGLSPSTTSTLGSSDMGTVSIASRPDGSGDDVFFIGTDGKVRWQGDTPYWTPGSPIPVTPAPIAPIGVAAFWKPDQSGLKLYVLVANGGLYLNVMTPADNWTWGDWDAIATGVLVPA